MVSPERFGWHDGTAVALKQGKPGRQRKRFGFRVLYALPTLERRAQRSRVRTRAAQWVVRCVQPTQPHMPGTGSTSTKTTQYAYAYAQIDINTTT
eukprot:scaffold8069_cov126-Isochrysis_galbana.AAC.3